MRFLVKPSSAAALKTFLALSSVVLSGCASSAPTTDLAMSDAERGPASALEGSKVRSFKDEFGRAPALNSYLGLLGYNMQKNSKLAVLTKWALLNPGDVRKELLQSPDGFEIGFYRAKVSGHSSSLRVITRAENAFEITQNPISFTSENALTETALTKSVEAALPQIEAALPSVVAQVLSENHYEGRHLNGQAFYRIDLVAQLGSVLPETINARYLGLAKLNPVKAREWSRATLDQAAFNLVGDTRVQLNAQTALVEATAAKPSLRTSLSVHDVLQLVSRDEATSTAIAHVIDMFLKNPASLEKARVASQHEQRSELDALIQEALRLRPVLPYQLFYVKDDVTLRSGLSLKKGQSVLVLHSVANRDAHVSQPTGIFGLNDNDAVTRLVQAEVRAAVAAVVALPGLRRASGDKGQIERRFLIAAASSPFQYDDFRFSFPESFVIESTIDQPSAKIQTASRAYLYDDYLNDYDRDEFRLCASGQLPDNYTSRDVIPAIVRGLKVNKSNFLKRENKDLFFCRLEKNFRDCLTSEAKATHFFYLESGDKARAAYQRCASKAPLTPTEAAFYPAVMFGDDLDETKINTTQSARTSGPDYRFEDYLKFYNHYTARSSLMNPVGMVKFKKQNRDLLFYVRLNLDFRDCIGVPVVTHDAAAKVGLKVYRDLSHQYDFCKAGVWNQDSLRREGALSDEERFFYESIMLGPNSGASP